MVNLKLMLKVAIAALLLVLYLGVVGTREANCDVCGEGVGVPPFVGTDAVDPNVLLLVDNSASMYDLAAAGTTGICYDDSYVSSTDYSGYFRTYVDPGDPLVEPYLEDYWYVYNMNTGRFEKSTLHSATAADNHCNDVSGTKFSSDDVCVTMIDIGTGANPDYTEVTSFAARGNFLNWAAASKLDIEKKVLTGGKIDSANQELIMESRGCLDHRYVKKIAVEDASEAIKYLTLGIKGGYANLTQIEIFEVTDTGFDVTGCQAALEEMARMDPENPRLGVLKGYINECLEQTDTPTTLEADSNAVFNQTTQDCWYMNRFGIPAWEEANLTLDNIKNGCQKVYSHLANLPEPLYPSDIPIGDTAYACFGVNKPQQGYAGRCWDTGQICTPIECDDSVYPVADLTAVPPSYGASEVCWDDGKVRYCSGNYNVNKDTCNKDWKLKLDCVGEVVNPSWDEFLNPGDLNYQFPDGYIPPVDSTDCLHDALIDYCGYFSTPEVIDPSDQEGSVSGEYYNAPAILIETAVEAQLDDPLLTMNGRIYTPEVPEGILNKNASRFRFGAMAFNEQGQATECDAAADEHLLIDCDNKMDGARVISYLAGAENNAQLTDAINSTPATTWTPLAEAMYSAIGYISQNPAMRLNPGDFLTQADMDEISIGLTSWSPGVSYPKGAKVTHGDYVYLANETGTSCALNTCDGPESDELFWSRVEVFPDVADPVQSYCQTNNVILISEGASTVDIAPDVQTLIGTINQNDGDTDNGNCGGFKGSTYLDDLTWYGWLGDLWGNNPDREDYSKIRTWIVESSLRGSESGDECEPTQLLADAAYNGSLLSQSDTGDIFTPKFTAGNEVLFRIQLQTAFEAIMERIASGSAASVISASRSGEGALYQAIFWPDKDSGRIDPLSGNRILVKWTGEVHAFLVDSRGVLYLDDCKNGDTGCQTGRLDEPYDSNGDGVKDSLLDTPIVVYGDEIGQEDTSGSIANGTKGCPGRLVNGEIAFFNEATGACWETPIPLEDLDYLWSTSEWLNRDDVDDNISYNRSIDGENKFIFTDSGSNPDKRFIFTWNDLNNDGVVDDSEMRDFEPDLPGLGTTNSEGLPPVDVSYGRGPVPVDFGIDPAASDAVDQVNKIIRWLRGEEIAGFRERLVSFDKNESGAVEPLEYAVWKLGDVIHSTPVSVATPAENYHQLYRDNSYGEFVARWEKRRHMIYFGANDGMLHAINGGFFDQENNKFCREKDCGSTANTPRLGAEMWAYVPYNLLPHLSCLSDYYYALDNHKYYVDLRPRIFDVQIFEPESACNDGAENPTPLAEGCIHPNGWGTIMVGGMRFGGSEVRPGTWVDENGNSRFDNRDFTSAYFIFDITDPERVPMLLGEFTRSVDDTGSSDEVELGYTTVIPTMVPMKRRDEAISGIDTDCDGDYVSDPELSVWYLLLGSGPTELEGTSDRNGSVSVIPLDRFVTRVTGDVKRDMRIPSLPPAEDTRAYPWNIPGDPGDGYPLLEEMGYGTITLPDTQSFISDMITVDMQVERDYFADSVYFGTVSGNWGSWGGKMYRIVTREECASDNDIQRLAQPSEWDLGLLFDAQQPIVSAPTVGTDGTAFWVYFGSGRFFHDNDKTDSSSNALQTYYGIREPVSDGVDCGTLTWAEVLKKDASSDPLFPYAISTIGVFPLDRGQLGLLKVGDIRVLSTPSRNVNEPDTLVCKDDIGVLNDNGTPGDLTDDFYEYNDTSCLPSTVLSGYGGTRSFQDLIDTISGTSKRCGLGTMGTDGWYRDFPEPRERNLGQATLLGGLLNYTTYQPYDDICLAEGLSYLYSVHYQTGTAWIEDVFGNIAYNSNPRQVNPERIYLGAGLTTTPNIHVGKQEGGKVFIQTSTGRIVEIPQPNLPSQNVKSGRIKWLDIDR